MLRIMARELESIEQMTLHEACMKYADFFFGFIITKQNLSNPFNSEGLVVCIAETEEEMHAMPSKSKDGKYISRMRGYAAKSMVELGDIVTRCTQHA